MNASLVPLDLPPVKMISMKAIKADHDVQSRVEIDRAHAKGMSDNILRKLATPPPIVVFFDGRWYWIGDGFHRHFAYTQLKAQEMPCEVREGTRRDAMIYSAGANQRGKTGLERTKEDIRKAVRMLMDDETWKVRSIEQIASHVGCSAMMAKREILRWASHSGKQLSETVSGTDGRVVLRKQPKVPTGRITPRPGRGSGRIFIDGQPITIPVGNEDPQTFADAQLQNWRAKAERHNAFSNDLSCGLTHHHIASRGVRHSCGTAISAIVSGHRIIVATKEDSVSGLLKSVGILHCLTSEAGKSFRQTIVIPCGYRDANRFAGACAPIGIDVMDPDELVAALQAEAQTDPPAEPPAKD
jgi:hypothetical protein